MSKIPKPKKPANSKTAERKVSKTYRLTESKISEARRILGADTATAAIETALDMVVFRHELMEGTRAMRGVAVTRFDDAEE
jgi:hypothetical protein